jgi:hypothetical protein
MDVDQFSSQRIVRPDESFELDEDEADRVQVAEAVG